LVFEKVDLNFGWRTATYCFPKVTNPEFAKFKGRFFSIGKGYQSLDFLGLGTTASVSIQLTPIKAPHFDSENICSIIVGTNVYVLKFDSEPSSTALFRWLDLETLNWNFKGTTTSFVTIY